MRVAELSRPVAGSSTDGAKSAVQRVDGHKLEELTGPREPRAPTAIAEPETDSRRKPHPRRTEPPPVPTLAMNIVIAQLSTRESRLGIFTALGFRMNGLAQRTTNLRKQVDS